MDSITQLSLSWTKKGGSGSSAAAPGAATGRMRSAVAPSGVAS